MPISPSRPDLCSLPTTWPRWSVTVASLANQRSLRRGPTYLKLGGAIRYALADVEAYETAGRVELAAA